MSLKRHLVGLLITQSREFYQTPYDFFKVCTRLTYMYMLYKDREKLASSRCCRSSCDNPQQRSPGWTTKQCIWFRAQLKVSFDPVSQGVENIYLLIYIRNRLSYPHAISLILRNVNKCTANSSSEWKAFSSSSTTFILLTTEFRLVFHKRNGFVKSWLWLAQPVHTPSVGLLQIQVKIYDTRNQCLVKT